MIHYHEPEVRSRLLEGNFGLEKESLRVDENGHMAKTPHPFSDPHIVRDFCENQTEINTKVYPSVDQAIKALEKETAFIQLTLKKNHELLWPFSNPCLIENEEDIPMAIFEENSHSRTYREYLSDRYGRYKMTFSGIHYNFSFGNELLEADFKYSPIADFKTYKDRLYLDVSMQVVRYGWLINALVAASPVVDGSFYEKSLIQNTYFTGMGSIRDSEYGYWNFFVPIFEYDSLEGYIQSIESYCTSGMLKEPRELYYPVRLKPPGINTLENLREFGVEHIELRMLDLNPLVFCGLEEMDARFIHLFLVWMACQPAEDFSARNQMMAVQNFKNAAHFDLKTTKIVSHHHESLTVFDAAFRLLLTIRSFYEKIAPDVLNVIDFQIAKLKNPKKNRYAWIIRDQFGTNYIQKGLDLARKQQQEAAEIFANS